VPKDLMPTLPAPAVPARGRDVPARTPMPPLWLLVLVTISGSISMHLFVPALPVAAADLHAGVGPMQMAISLYLLGLAAGQLVYGPLSDAYGRRRVLLAGLALFTLGGLAVACAQDLPTLLAARVVQALGACAGMALGRAIIRDTTQGDEMVRQLALLSLMIMLWPGVAPMIGAALAAGFGWRSIFIVLAALGVIAFSLAWRRLPETRQGTGVFTARSLMADYGELLRSARFVGLTVGAGAVTTAVYAFLAAAPFILTGRLHQPVQVVGVASGLVMLGSAAGNALASGLVRRVGTARMIVAGLAMSTAAAALLIVLVLAGHMSVPALVGTMMVFTCGAGLVNPALLAKALSLHPRLAGSAAGLYGFSQMGLGTISTSFASWGSDPAVATAAVLLGMALLSCACIAVALQREPRS
jgi:MFS transporter, DHA1 family, multidrug resistance protein